MSSHVKWLDVTEEADFDVFDRGGPMSSLTHAEVEKWSIYSAFLSPLSTST